MNGGGFALRCIAPPIRFVRWVSAAHHAAAFTISSMTFFASPKTIIVLSI
jgi:hypothetical protein